MGTFIGPFEGNLGSGVRRSFSELESACEISFLSGGQYYHLTTDGTSQETVFASEEDLKYAMTCLAICLASFNVRMIACVFMNNHVHWIMEGKEEECLALFSMFKARFNRYLISQERVCNLSGFECQLIPIDDLRQMRNEIAYVHRNPFVARNNVLPHTYRWGTGYLYFNPIADWEPCVPLDSLKYREKRHILRSRSELLQVSFAVTDGYASPRSFSDYKKGMSFFRHASHYFSLLSKNHESYGEIAGRLGDGTSLNDEEMYSVARSLSQKQFHIVKLKQLSVSQRLELARMLKFDYRASNEQISRTLALDHSLVNELLPII